MLCSFCCFDLLRGLLAVVLVYFERFGVLLFWCLLCFVGGVYCDLLFACFNGCGSLFWLVLTLLF